MSSKVYHLVSYSFNAEFESEEIKEGLKEAISSAKNKIADGFDKVTICDEDGVVNRIYYNVNGQARRL